MPNAQTPEQLADRYLAAGRGEWALRSKGAKDFNAWKVETLRRLHREADGLGTGYDDKDRVQWIRHQFARAKAAYNAR
jgi:hypothetical protein